jgi:fyn-related kinase
MSNHDALDQIVQGYRMPRPINCPQPIYEMMLQCWSKEPQARPTFAYLYTFLDDYFVSSQGAYLPSDP